MSVAARGAREDEGVVMSWAACGMREASSAAACGPVDEDDTSGAACGTREDEGAESPGAACGMQEASATATRGLADTGAPRAARGAREGAEAPGE